MEDQTMSTTTAQSTAPELTSVEQVEMDPLDEFQALRKNNTAPSVIFSDLWDHHGERLIAFDPKTGELICNRCIYVDGEREYQFTSAVARRIAISYKASYNEVSKALESFQEVHPDIISKRLQQSVADFLQEAMEEIIDFMNEKEK